MKELASRPDDIKKIVKQETVSVAMLGTVQEIGRGFASVFLAGSSAVPVLIPDHILVAQLVEGTRILCVKANELAPWIATAVFDQPDRYARTVKSADISSEPDWGAWGPILDIHDIVRGYKDEYMGQSVDARWEALTVGAGTYVIEDGAHGGTVLMTTGTTNQNSNSLWLGDTGSATDNALNNPGWTILIRCACSHESSARYYFGIGNPTFSDEVMCAYEPVWNANWRFRLQNAGGGETVVTSSEGGDTNYHNHAFEVKGGEIKHWVDKVLVNEKTDYDMFTNARTPFVGVQTRTTAARSLRVDFFAFIAKAAA